MHKSFWFGTELGNFIFPGLNVTSTKGFIAICIGLASLAIIYEGMKILQIKLRKMTMISVHSNEGSNSEHSSLLSRMSRRNNEPATNLTCSYWCKWILEVTHWSFHTTLSYLLMLAVMTFNGYVSIALIIGSGLGYWFFGPILVHLNVARLKQKRKIIKCEPECAEATTSFERRASTVSIIAEELVTNVDVH